MTTPQPSTPFGGRQVHLERAGYSADIATLGAALRTLRYGDDAPRDLIRPYSPDELHPHHAGTVLAPWPNRVIDGRYTWAGAQRQLDLSEPARGHALHGLVVWDDFEILSVEPDRAVLGTVIQPRTGYPHRVGITVEHALAGNGLTTTLTASLLAGEPAPFGWGAHPYLVAPGERVDEWTLHVPARTVQPVTGPRLLPQEPVPVNGTGLDFGTARQIADTYIDHAYTDLDRDERGTARVTVLDAAGRGTALSFGRESGWVQVHTGDLPDQPAMHRTGLAVEAMSCPPGAFNSGTDVLTLAPGEEITASWTLSAVGD